MLLPIELFHVCVRIHIDISDIRRDRPAGAAGADGAGTCRTRVVPRAGTFPRGSPARPPRAGVASAAVWLWVLGLRVSRALRPTSLAAGGYRVSKTPV